MKDKNTKNDHKLAICIKSTDSRQKNIVQKGTKQERLITYKDKQKITI